MNKFNIEQTNLDINSFGGLSLIQALTNKIKLPEHFYQDRFRTGDANILLSMIGLLTLGKSKYADINQFSNSRIFKHSLGISKIPTEITLRQNLDKLARRKSVLEAAENYNISLLSKMNFTPIQSLSGDYYPLDIDVTPLDNSKSKKEGVSCTYKLFDGYAPMMAYIAREGYLIASEFRRGSQHCQNGTPEFLKYAITTAKKVLPNDSKLLIRMDAGNHSAENFEVCNQANTFWIVKRNLRKEPKERWIDFAKKCGECISDEDGKRVFVGAIYHAHEEKGDIKVPTDVIIKITETYESENGQQRSDITIDVDVETYTTNLPEDPLKIIELYHDHATSEQFHSEIKSDMGVERLPSGKFETNKLIFCLAKIAYNLLRRIGVDMVKYSDNRIIKKGVKRRRIRTVLQEIMYSACQLVINARKMTIRFCKYDSAYSMVRLLYDSYL